MKKISLAVLLLSPFAMLQSLKAQPQFNHITVYVVNLEKSAAFYKNALQLQEISEPFHDGRHVWFKIGEHSQLHVVSGAKEIIAHDINIHLAFTVRSVENFAGHLDSLGIKYGNWAQSSKEPQVRPDGIKQIYLQDPDGYWLEVNDDKF